MRSLIAIFILVAVFATSAGMPKATAQGNGQANDMFADIAARQEDFKDKRLVRPEPPKLDLHPLPLASAAAEASFTPMAKITTEAQLTAELERQRASHAPFMKDLAPALKDQRVRLPLRSFDWRVETDADRTDFVSTLAGQGQWKKVTIPHYGGPMGRVSTYYRTTFEVTPAMLAKGALFAHFNGVDYKAHVFVNGAFLGSHEGVFGSFEFEFTRQAHVGQNTLLVKVDNDHTMLASNAKVGYLSSDGLLGEHAGRVLGDKIFAAVGPCWNDPYGGWQLCNPGMGIYQDVTIEARPRIFVNDIFVRPLPEQNKAEAWIELFGCDNGPTTFSLQLSVFGQNFSQTVITGQAYPSNAPNGRPARRGRRTAAPAAMHVEAGINCYKIPLEIPNPRLWEPATPWLYQVQVKLMDEKGQLLDTAHRQFGMRSFRMEYVKEPKGRMYLNGKGIRLRGANTMGALQQCVIRKDWKQLTDDILLAKITNMNYMRLTQMPVQDEVYEYCDRLGLMVQTDLPLFGTVHRSQFCEVVRQAEEMERLVRAHPSNIMITYMNEPTPRAGDKLYHNISREEMTRLFESADAVVRMNNPDRVIKAVDGDYDPPGPGLSDNHCYTGWYNGHGVEMGALHKGYWQRVKPGWWYGCGEFGSEGLDSVALMRKYYPKEWLPQTPEEEKTWMPDKILGGQTAKTHVLFFETPHTLADWVERSHQHQAWATRTMTEAFRRDGRMTSFAIHLFIDVYPDGWMKAIMDCERRPKLAWFAYRDALTPLAANLRCDHRAFFAGDPMPIEAWVCNDRNDTPAGATLHYQIELDGKVLQSGSTSANIPVLNSAYQGSLPFRAPEVDKRALVTVRLGILDAQGKVLHDTAATYDIFPQSAKVKDLRRAYVIGSPSGKAARLAGDLGCERVYEGTDPARRRDPDRQPAGLRKERRRHRRGGSRRRPRHPPGTARRQAPHRRGRPRIG